jgi:hypothetical protein
VNTIVPRPSGTKPGIVWFLSQAVQIFWRTQHKTKIYETNARQVYARLSAQLAKQFAAAG